jgi:hypothetical protein
MTSANKATVVYIQESQSPVEKRHGLNLMISMLSQRKDADGKMLLHKSVYQMAEIFVMMDITQLPDADQLMRIIEAYPHDDLPSEVKRQFLIQLSDGVFDESPVKQSSSSAMPRWDQQLDETDTEQDQRSTRVRSEVEVQKPVNAEQFRGILDDYMYGMGKTSSKEKDTVQKELLLEKFMKNIDKLHGGHVTSMIVQVLYPRENIDNQARAITSIFQAIDPKMQSLIQVPLASNTINQLHLSSSQASLALACLIRQFYGQGNTAIRKQELALKACYAAYKQEIVTPLNFRKNVRTELAVYDSVWRYYSTKSDKRLTDRDNCEMLIKEVGSVDFPFAKQLQRELQGKDSLFDMEMLLGALEENQRLVESLKTESEPPAKSGKGGGTNSADKKSGAQILANPAIQQQQKCSICGNEHDESKCPKEIDRLKKAAQKRGDRLPGSEKSTKRDSQREEATAGDANEGCYMCCALGKISWTGHPPSKCWSQEKFTKRMADPEQRPKLIERMATQPSPARGSKSDRPNPQSQQTRNTHSERQTQSHRQGSVSEQQMQQMQQMQSPVFREYANSFSQPYFMSQQSTGGQSEYVSPWQLHNSAQNSSQFFQPQGQQNMQRTAHVSQTMGPGYTGEAPQIQFLHPSPGPNPMVLQVSPQSQIFRQVDARQMPNVSEQGMMSIGAQPGNSAQQSDRYSGSESSSANTAVRAQPSRGAALLTQSMRNYLCTSPYSQSDAEQHGNQHTVVNHGTYFATAMTAVTVIPMAKSVNPLEIAVESFEQMPIWILQRFSMADIDPSQLDTSSLLSKIKLGARDIVERRVLEGEELTHQVIKGVAGHVDGLGQCFIDARNVLNGVDECSQVTRNRIINDFVSNEAEIVGWVTAKNLLKTEYDVDLSDAIELSNFVSDYVEGKLQSGTPELLYAAKRDKKHYIIVSNVYGENTCAVTAIFPCYENCSNEIQILKAGDIKLEQLEAPMVLFPHGGIINPFVMG